MDHGFTQHSSHHRAAAPAAAWAGADAGALADLLEGLGAGLNGFHHGAFADFVTQTSRLEIFDDRLFPGFSFLLVDNEDPNL